jgi:hypothetical protein
VVALVGNVPACGEKKGPIAWVEKKSLLRSTLPPSIPCVRTGREGLGER